MGKCQECGRVFDPTNELDADEWAYGHDCEPAGETPEAAELRELGYVIHNGAMIDLWEGANV